MFDELNLRFRFKVRGKSALDVRLPEICPHNKMSCKWTDFAPGSIFQNQFSPSDFWTNPQHNTAENSKSAARMGFFLLCSDAHALATHDDHYVAAVCPVDPHPCRPSRGSGPGDVHGTALSCALVVFEQHSRKNSSEAFFEEKLGLFRQNVFCANRRLPMRSQKPIKLTFVFPNVFQTLNFSISISIPPRLNPARFSRIALCGSDLSVHRLRGRRRSLQY